VNPDQRRAARFRLDMATRAFDSQAPFGEAERTLLQSDFACTKLRLVVDLDDGSLAGMSASSNLRRASPRTS
jgi:hypothetical protein